MDLIKVVILAVLVEAIVHNLKPIWKGIKHSSKISLTVSLLLGIGLAILTETDVFAVIGLPLSYPVIGSGLTGIVASRGSNFVHDLWDKLLNAKKEA